MAHKNVHFRHDKKDSNERETPDDFFKKLNDEFRFDIDAAATGKNTKCSGSYWDKEDDALSQCWQEKVVWCNPPYSKEKITLKNGKTITDPNSADAADFVEKAFFEWMRGDCTAVLLLAARPDTKAWHKFILPWRAVEVRFVPGRLKFVGEKDPAPFPSAVVIYRAGLQPKIKIDPGDFL